MDSDCVIVESIPPLLVDYIIAAHTFLTGDSPGPGGRSFEEVVDEMKRTNPGTLLQYGEKLAEGACSEETMGFYGEAGVFGLVNNDFVSRFGPLFNHLVY